jgi:alkanesulfonate monooxygenase SsuD/methylene tetrahydromethanopterin reductase-like flavin-dependent oxidoreductase (luciferase family)
MEFKPTRPPRGRLARLGVVLDTRDAPGRLSEIARMCDGAGIDALWVREHAADTDGEPRPAGWNALTLIGAEVYRPRLGVMVTTALRSPEELAAMADALDPAIGGRLELGLSSGRIVDEHWAFGLNLPDSDADPHARRLRRYAEQVRALLDGPTISVEAITPGQLAVSAGVADDVLLPAAAVRDTKAISVSVRTACDRADRDPASLGVAVELPVSIGRTTAEAHARAEAASPFEVDGSEQPAGIFGTLEQCQERVIDLAHAGVTDLRCVIPNAPDVHDVIAQLTAIAVGTVDILAPGVPRSKAPDPPVGWGGRTRPA